MQIIAQSCNKLFWNAMIWKGIWHCDMEKLCIFYFVFIFIVHSGEFRADNETENSLHRWKSLCTVIKTKSFFVKIYVNLSRLCIEKYISKIIKELQWKCVWTNRWLSRNANCNYTAFVWALSLLVSQRIDYVCFYWTVAQFFVLLP